MDLFKRISALNQTLTIKEYANHIYPDDFDIDDLYDIYNDSEIEALEELDRSGAIQFARNHIIQKYDKKSYHQFRKTKTYHVPSYREEMKYFQRKNPELAFKF